MSIGTSSITASCDIAVLSLVIHITCIRFSVRNKEGKKGKKGKAEKDTKEKARDAHFAAHCTEVHKVSIESTQCKLLASPLLCRDLNFTHFFHYVKKQRTYQKEESGIALREFVTRSGDELIMYIPSSAEWHKN